MRVQSMRVLVVVAALPLVVSPRAVRAIEPSSQTPAREQTLQIVIIEGEDAINIVQQKTAVAPVVEVRDRNNQPVAGAIVRFGITRGRATFGGARTLTVTTNTAGRAAVTGLAPTGPGALQISATATFQGQTAAATIAQTNVMTAAQAGAASGSAGSASTGATTSSSTSGAGAGSGGLSTTTTLGVIGAAAGGGALLAVKWLAESAVESAVEPTKYSGPYSGVLVLTFGSNCFYYSQITGTLELQLTVGGDGSVTGTASAGGQSLLFQHTCNNPVPLNVPSDYGWGQATPAVTGTTASLGFYRQATFPTGGGIWELKASMNGNVITGTLTHTSLTTQGVANGTVDFPVTLQ